MHARRLAIALGTAMLAVLCVAATAMALTRRDDVSADDMHAFGVGFRSVGWMDAETFEKDPSTGITINRRCTAVLLSPNTAMTAAHCVTGPGHTIDIYLTNTNFKLGDFINFPPKVIAPVASVDVSPGWNCEGCDIGGINRAGWDVAILHLGLDLFQPSVSRIYLGDMVGQDVAIVGYGALSTGLESFDNFNSSVQDGRKMAGTNVVDRLDDFRTNSTYAWLFDFDSPSCDKPWQTPFFGPATSDLCPTPLEASYGAGDSGGPMFVQIDGQWMLAGVASSILAIDGKFGTYGQVAFVSNLTLDTNREFLQSEGLLDNAIVATPTPTEIPTATATATATATQTPSPTPTPEASPTRTPTPTPAPTKTPTPTPTKVATPTPSPTVSPTIAPPPTPMATATSTPATPTETPTPVAENPPSGGICSGGGAADASFLLVPVGLLLLMTRRLRHSLFGR